MKRKGSILRGALYSAALVSAIAAAGCSKETKQQLGLAKTAPDEFAVVTRAPLSVPPDYTLRPPRPGSDRPMEDNTVAQARKTLFGVDDVSGTPQSSASPSFMDRIGVDQADSGIRETLDAENKTYIEENRPVAEKLLFWDKKSTVEGDVLDPKEEYEKISKENGQSSGAADE